jgi:hypothetical protein
MSARTAKTRADDAGTDTSLDTSRGAWASQLPSRSSRWWDDTEANATWQNV